jgi:hypothetical protein
MKVDVYHHILGKVYDAVGGQSKKLVNMADIVKQEGFASSKDDIFEFMSHEGWIVDAHAPGEIFLTPWGIEEHKRFSERNKPDKQKHIEDAVKASNMAVSTARDLADTLEKYAKALPLSNKESEAKKLHAEAMKLFEDIKKHVAASKPSS